MPILNGIEATCIIRSLERSLNIEGSIIVAVSAQDNEKSALQDMLEEKGFNTLEGKPISKNDFRKLLKKYGIGNES